MTAYVTEICPECGNLKSVCSLEGQQWFPQPDICYATAARERTRRALYAKHGSPDPGDAGDHYMDGVGFWMSQQDLTPDETFGGALDVLSPEQPVGEQAETA